MLLAFNPAGLFAPDTDHTTDGSEERLNLANWAGILSRSGAEHLAVHLKEVAGAAIQHEPDDDWQVLLPSSEPSRLFEASFGPLYNGQTVEWQEE